MNKDAISYIIFRSVASHSHARNHDSVLQLKFVVFAYNLYGVAHVKHMI